MENQKTETERSQELREINDAKETDDLAVKILWPIITLIIFTGGYALTLRVASWLLYPILASCDVPLSDEIILAWATARPGAAICILVAGYLAYLIYMGSCLYRDFYTNPKSPKYQ